ncbi:MAG: DUF3108 domain-containing protein [Planctomycetota bacterium]|nr:DUF3108 domain-containing protein [Planctomycetota bacterium]
MRQRFDLTGWAVVLAAACGILLGSAALAETAPEAIRVQAQGDNGTAAKAPRGAEVPPELAPAALDLRVSEKLFYDIRVNGIPAGKALLEVSKTEALDGDKGPQVWIVLLSTRSNRAVSLFYDVHDWAKSKIDVKGGFSRFYRIYKEEGGVRTEERIAFTYDIGSMEAAYERPRSDDRSQWRTHKIPLTGKVLDPLSALYYLRTLPLKDMQAGHTFGLPVCADCRVWNTRFTVMKRHPALDVGYLKGRDCIEVEPELRFKGLFERKSRIRAWLDVATGIPLKMEAEIPIGPAEVVLTEASSSALPAK